MTCTKLYIFILSADHELCNELKGNDDTVVAFFCSHPRRATRLPGALRLVPVTFSLQVYKVYLLLERNKNIYSWRYKEYLATLTHCRMQVAVAWQCKIPSEYILNAFWMIVRAECYRSAFRIVYEAG